MKRRKVEPKYTVDMTLKSLRRRQSWCCAYAGRPVVSSESQATPERQQRSSHEGPHRALGAGMAAILCRR